jgi:hypothetical protein
MIARHSSPGEARKAIRRAHALLALVLCALLAPRTGLPQTSGRDSKPTDYEVEAAYLSNFGRFVEWPQKPNSGEPFDICVYGPDPFGPLLDGALRGENISGSPLVPRRVAGTDAISGCRILFISQSKETQLDALLPNLPGVLTVSDLPGFSRRGGMIEFVVEGNRVRFEINLAVARRAGLVLSSQLLKLATTVRRAP